MYTRLGCTCCSGICWLAFGVQLGGFCVHGTLGPSDRAVGTNAEVAGGLRAG